MELLKLKVCTECGLPGEFAKRKNGRDGLKSVCKSCDRAYRKNWYANNTEKFKGYIKNWQQRNPLQYKAIKRSHSLRQRYGLSPENFLSMLAEQNNRCAICQLEFGDDRSPYVDHCHEATEIDKRCSVRGLLCSKCNFGIGMVDESTAILESLVSYLSLPVPAKAPVYGYSRPKPVEREYRAGLGNLCMCCHIPLSSKGKSKKCIDHDHHSKKIRGVLCHRCNLAIGHFQENSVVIQAAVQYLKCVRVYDPQQGF